MSKINILHLSDLHISKDKISDILIVRDALFEDLESHFDSQGLTPSLVIFSGDFVQIGDKGYDQEESQFELALTEFINPLLKLLDLRFDSFFFCAGNHDIQRSKVDKFYESGLESNLNDTPSVNDLLNKVEDNHNPFERIDNFNRFRNSLIEKNPYLVNKNYLYSTYNYCINGVKIGIACLNSSWRAYGGDEDKGKLILGERQINWAYDDLKSCDLKLLNMHHPITWLKTFDANQCKFLIAKYFDMLFHGHIHELGSEFNMSPFGHIAISSAGAVFCGRALEGYSFVEIDIASHNVTTHLRRYNNKKQNFVPAVELIDSGIYTFPILGDKKETTSRALTVLKDCYDEIQMELSASLLTHRTNSIAPKELSEIFVLPNLSEKSEFYKDTDKELDVKSRKIDLNDLVNSEDNLLFYGRRESGKTTILNYILQSYCGHRNTSKIRLPIRIDYKNLPKGKRGVKNAIFNFLHNSQKINVDFLLEHGGCVILFDDFLLDETQKLHQTIEFIKKYDQNRYIFAVDEDLLEAMEIEEPEIEIQYKKIFIRSFGRKQIRMLTRNWFKKKPVDTNKVVSTIINNLKKTSIPSTPMVISILLWIFERNEDFTPINEATLIEIFIGDILERLTLDEAKSEKVDFRIKQDFLSQVAYHMIFNDQYILDKKSFRKMTENYFDGRMLTVDTDKFVNEFFNKGILFGGEGEIQFRFKCFHTYFASLRILEDKEFYDFILREENYLKFSEEIIFVTGISRKNKDILEKVKGRLNESFEEIEELIDLKDLEKFEIDKTLFSNYDLKDLAKHKLSEDEKDEMADSSITHSAKNQEITRKEYYHYSQHFMENLVLYSKVLKNCELESRDVKLSAFKLCMRYYGLLTLLFMDMINKIKFEDEEFGQDDFKTREGEEVKEGIADYKDARHLITIIIPLMIQSFMFHTLGTRKLDQVIEEEFTKTKYPLVKYFCSSLYFDLKLPGHIDKTHQFVKKVNSKIILELIFVKLQLSYVLGNLSPREEQKILNVLSEVQLKLLHKSKIAKSAIIDKLKELKAKVGEKIRELEV